MPWIGIPVNHSVGMFTLDEVDQHLEGCVQGISSSSCHPVANVWIFSYFIGTLLRLAPACLGSGCLTPGVSGARQRVRSTPLLGRFSFGFLTRYLTLRSRTVGHSSNQDKSLPITSSFIVA